MDRKVHGGILFTIGYLLSPLSFWNDIFINIPIAYGFGFLFGLIAKELFMPFIFIGYWLSNVAGMLLMHYGAKQLASKKEVKYTSIEIAKQMLYSIIYTVIIVLLIYFGILKFPTEYFK